MVFAVFIFSASSYVTFMLPGYVLMLDFEKAPIALGIQQVAEDLNLELFSRIPSAKCNKSLKVSIIKSTRLCTEVFNLWIL